VSRRDVDTDTRIAHRPVLRDEVVAALCVLRDGAFVDCTFGRGGHTRSLLDALGAGARLLAIDRDPEAIAAAEALARSDARLVVRRGRFADLGRIAAEAGFTHVAGVLMDLGVSSPQLDDPARGFSFRADGPLDMRMDPTAGPSAADWLAVASEAELARVFADLGEERHARRIARAIVERRRETPFTRTLDLAALVEANQPRPDPHKHGATRVFQAIRIHINHEIEELEAGLAAALDLLAAGGRLAVITFHSIEDRVVKRTFAEWARGPALPRRLPVRSTPTVRARLLGRSVQPSDAEVRANPRARSARLRVVEKAA
jgi:16S rRNA (cytosine1402-N4)-methyltransferase